MRRQDCASPKIYWLGFILLYCSSSLFAQKETVHWFIPAHRHYTFNANDVTGVEEQGVGYGAPTTSISDSAGNLLLYSSDGGIYDNKYQLLPYFGGFGTALHDGNINSFFVKKPGSLTQYYYFYSGRDYLAPNGLLWIVRCAIVDLSLNNGYGDVVTADVLIENSISNGFTVVRGEDDNFWLITNKFGTNELHSWKVTASGIDNQPVTSTGSYQKPEQYNFVEMKPSPNGKLIAGMNHYYNGGEFPSVFRFVEVFDFNQHTGILTYRVNTATENFINSYFPSRLEFSPDNRLLYAAYLYYSPGLQPCGFAAGHLVQYNLCYTDSASFSKYAAMVANDFSFCSMYIWGMFQLAPDKKIYFPYVGTYSMGNITSPNHIGSSLGYHLYDNRWNVGSSPKLPTFYHAYTERAVKNNIVYSGGCYPNATKFEITNDTLHNIRWNFGDAASGSENLSTTDKPVHFFSKPGFYLVTADLYNSKGVNIETATDSIEIKDPAKRLFTGMPKDTTLCLGDQFLSSLRVMNGIFHWSFRNSNGLFDMGTADSMLIGPSGSGTYIVEMRQNDCDGCTMLDSINVKVLRKPYVDLYSDRGVCSSDSIQLSTNNEGATTYWNTGETTPNIWVKRSGTYFVESEYDNNGCISRDTVVITEQTAISVNLPPDTTLCNESTLPLDAGVKSGYYYYWQDNSHASSYVVTKAGTYWVNVTAPNGCRASDTVHVAYVNAASISLGNDTLVCAGSQYLLSVNAPGASYLWSTGTKNNTISITSSGDYWVQVNNKICTTADTVHIDFKEPPTVRLGNDTVLCEKTELILNASNSNSTYLWQDGNTNANYTVNEAGQYWVEVNQQGCVVSDTIQVYYNALPVVNIGKDTMLCEGEALQLSAASSQLTTYKWQDNSSSSFYKVTCAGSYNVHVTNLSGCTNSDTILVAYQALLQFALGGDTTLCDNQKLSFHFNLNNAIYQWQDGSQSNSYTIQSPGISWLSLNQNGCSRADTIQVTSVMSPYVNLGADTSICKGSSLLLSAFTPGATYEWQDHSLAQTFSVSKSGTYYISVSINNCSTSDTIQVAVIDKPSFSLQSQNLCAGQALVLQVAEKDATYLWQDGSTLNTFTVFKPGTYAVSVTNQCGETFHDVTVLGGKCVLAMPTAFTPNQDGINDVFRLPQDVSFTLDRFSIFDRFGNLLFETSDIHKGWDGKYKGIPLDSGTFIYIIQGQTIDKSINLKGTVTLLH